MTEEEKRTKVIHEYKEPIPEPFEKRRLNDIRNAFANNSAPTPTMEITGYSGNKVQESVEKPITHNSGTSSTDSAETKTENLMEKLFEKPVTYTDIKLEDISENFLSRDAKKKHKVIGQLFKTYW